MAEQEIDPAEISKQLQKPTGELGRQVALKMNEANRSLYELGWSMIDFSSVFSLLEIGFGNGDHLHWYFEQNPDIRVTGVDYSEDMCTLAEESNGQAVKNGRLTIRCASADDIPAGDESFDLAMGFNTIYFQQPPESFLEEIHRVLKPEGHLLIGYRPHSSFQNLPFPKDNFTLYEPEQVNSLLERNGFKVVWEERNTIETVFGEENSQTIELTDICVLAGKTEG